MGKDQQDLVGLQHQMVALLRVEEDVLLGVNRMSSTSIHRFGHLYSTFVCDTLCLTLLTFHSTLARTY
jgi:hypothetical protein